MVEYFEVNPLPECCQNCSEPDEGCCDECDHLGERFILPEEDQRQLDMLVGQRIKARKEIGTIKYDTVF